MKLVKKSAELVTDQGEVFSQFVQMLNMRSCLHAAKASARCSNNLTHTTCAFSEEITEHEKHFMALFRL